MKKLIQYICLLVVLFHASGCKKFLEQKSNEEVIPKTAQDLRELLLGNGYPTETFHFLIYMDDDLQFDNSSSQVGRPDALARFPVYTWQPTIYDNINKSLSGLSGNEMAYPALYARIMGCNAVLDYVSEVKGTNEELARIKAEALALRALHYYYLVNLYGSPYNKDKSSAGVPLKLSSGLSEKSIARSTVEEVYVQIVKDLNQAVSLFKDISITKNDFRINLPATYILLSRVYLYMGEWDRSIEAATLAIEKGGPLTNLNTKTAPYYILDYQSSEMAWNFGDQDSYFPPIFRPAVNLLSLYDTEDARLKIFFNADKSLPAKYSGLFSISRFGKGIRTAEAYLNRAEAQAEKAIGGNSSSAQAALADLNLLRSNRVSGYTGVIIGDATTLRAEIRKERRKELCFEDHRWFDLRRYGMPELTHTYKATPASSIVSFTLKENDPFYTLPIPDLVFNNNPLLTQNPSRNQALRVGQ